MTDTKIDITAEFLRTILDYNRESGILIWRARTAELFDSSYRTAEAKCRRWNKIYAGTIAGTLTKKGYLRIRVKNTKIPAHHIVWFLETGEWPDEIDHRDGNGQYNKFENLRNATSAQNAQNRRRRSTNKSGFTGVSLHSKNRWRAELTVRGVRHHLGSFKTREEARSAYLITKAKHHEFQPIPRIES